MSQVLKRCALIHTIRCEVRGRRANDVHAYMNAGVHFNEIYWGKKLSLAAQRASTSSTTCEQPERDTKTDPKSDDALLCAV
jgi:hypothetical protein